MTRPDYVGKPYAAVHTEPPRNYQWEQLSQDQLSAMRTKLVESVIQNIVQAIRGLFVPTGQPTAASDQLSDWSTDISDNLFGTIDDIVNSLFGWLGSGYTRTDSAQALTNTAATVATLSSAVAQLQNRQTSLGNGGNSAIVDFSLRPDSFTLGSDWSQTYYGAAGSGVWGIYQGRAAWSGSSSGLRGGDGRYNDEQSATDYQAIGVIFGSAPTTGLSGTSHNLIYGRMNVTSNTSVYVDFTHNSAELGCVVAGVKTAFTTAPGFSFKATSMYWLICGTTGGVRTYQVIEGTRPIISWTEVGTTSQYGASYRYMGAGVIAADGFFGTVYPGQLVAWAFSDNTPQPTLGTYGRVYRASAVGSALTSNVAGERLFPASVFDTVERITDDLSFDATTNKFTVTKAGPYIVTVAYQTTSTLVAAVSTYPVLYVNATMVKKGQALWWDASAAVQYSKTWTVYLEVGDEVQPGVFFTSSYQFGAVGEAAGTSTYMEITGITLV
jgi:hypothetical protein